MTWDNPFRYFLTVMRSGSFWKKWFSFTKREKTAALFLLVLVIIFTGIKYFLPDRRLADREEMKKFDSLVRLITDTVQQDTEDIAGTTVQMQQVPSVKKDVDHLLPEQIRHDPNTMRFVDWYWLGLPGKLIRTIMNYKAAGGYFVRKEDLKKIYGMNDSIYEAVSTWIVIPDSVRRVYAPPVARKDEIVIDLNRADSADLVRLPGIGPVLSGRILRFRNRLGGFYTVDQLKEVYGLSGQTYTNIASRLRVDTSRIRKINLNQCTLDELSAHPYINRWQANAIIAYRNYKGTIKSPDELVSEGVFNPDKYAIVSCYLSVK